MNIFADLHHQGLTHSLYLLFEKRLGWKLYFPIGIDWYHHGFWKVYDHPGTAKQYLEIANLKDSLTEESNLGKQQKEDGISYLHELASGSDYRMITFERFKDMNFDIILSSIPEHIDLYNQLIFQFQPKAKHIFQVGNNWGRLSRLGGIVKNILCSTCPVNISATINTVFYHQEFDLNVFKYKSPREHNRVNSYIHYMERLDLASQYRDSLSGGEFNHYGAGMPHQPVEGFNKLAKMMEESGWTWHYKPVGDGYGHILHNTYACGRPAIIWGSFYEGKLGNYLLKDLDTCIDISKHPLHRNIELIKHFSHPERHQRMCKNAYHKFKQIVNFNEEEGKIRKFLENLQ